MYLNRNTEKGDEKNKSSQTKLSLTGSDYCENRITCVYIFEG